MVSTLGDDTSLICLQRADVADGRSCGGRINEDDV